MRLTATCDSRRRGPKRAFACAVASILALAGTDCSAGQAMSSFMVEVNADKSSLQTPPAAQTGLCRRADVPGAFGAIVTVVCATGAVVSIDPRNGSPWGPTHGGAYRFLPPRSAAGVDSSGMDINTGLGTVTSWRVVRYSDYAYLELTVRW
jgi:hypothetical protein